MAIGGRATERRRATLELQVTRSFGDGSVALVLEELIAVQSVVVDE